MEKFKTLNGIIAHIELSNIDTDMIIPKQFLKTIKRDGLGDGLFYEMRFDEDGNPNNEFILNKPPFNNSKLIVAFDNFGCGSSREHAPWALLDFGIKVVLAKSFADIFYNNCFKNGILPIVLSQKEIEKIISEIKLGNIEIEVNLDKQIIVGKNINLNFEIDEYKKKCLLNGWDDIDLTLKQEIEITKFEKLKLKDWLLPGYKNEN
jgi:3-isopropylmalate/(R)-2-methylmalate dehydratase small subunit|tara:strand:+ start:20 stop:637 length:618 start_codon:yes stop_codon:yes gene_type:complete